MSATCGGREATLYGIQTPSTYERVQFEKALAREIDKYMPIDISLAIQDYLARPRERLYYDRRCFACERQCSYTGSPIANLCDKHTLICLSCAKKSARNNSAPYCRECYNKSGYKQRVFAYTILSEQTRGFLYNLWFNVDFPSNIHYRKAAREQKKKLAAEEKAARCEKRCKDDEARPMKARIESRDVIIDLLFQHLTEHYTHHKDLHEFFLMGISGEPIPTLDDWMVDQKEVFDENVQLNPFEREWFPKHKEYEYRANKEWYLHGRRIYICAEATAMSDSDESYRKILRQFEEDECLEPESEAMLPPESAPEQID